MYFAAFCGRRSHKRVVALVGISLHSLLDGVIYAMTFKISVVTGALAAIGMNLHKFPLRRIHLVLLRKGGIGPKNALYLAIVGAGLTPPLGVILSYPAVSWIGSEPLALSLAVSAGVLVYVGATHLLPSAKREPVQFSSVQFSSVQFSSVQFSSVQFSSVQFSSVQFSLLALLAEMLVAIGIVATHN